MRLVDLSQPFNMHSPGWIGYPSPKISYIQRHATNAIVSQYIETPLHVSTHIDSPMHGVSGGKDIASLPLERLCRQGVIVDISHRVGDWDVIRPEHITETMEVRRGDILIVHTGWHHFYNGQPGEDEVRYFCRHPGGDARLARWVVDMELAWLGIDWPSPEHPMLTIVRERRSDLRQEFEQRIGRRVEEFFQPEDFFSMHRIPFSHGIVHAENLGGDIDQVLNRRCLIGAFPWRFEGGEASPCRIVAFLDD